MPIDSDYLCRCGCGGVLTNDARAHGRVFHRGHAVRLVARLRRGAQTGDRAAFSELYSNGWTLERNPHRVSYGAELEFFGMERHEAVNLLKAQGIDTLDDGYHHEPKPYWRVTEDSSVSGEANELVSPILRVGEPSYKLMNKVTGTLRSAGATVDRSCGLHIHHNAKGMSTPEIADTVATWALFQPIINSMLPPSRSGGSEYCIPMYEPLRWHRDIMGKANLFDEANYSFGRYHAINLQSLTVHGSLEFRQHNGTMNGTKVNNWTRFTRLFMQPRLMSCLEVIAQYGSVDSFRKEATIPSMVAYLGGKDDLADYYVKRAASFAENRPDTDDRDDPAEDDEETEYEDCEECGAEYCRNCQAWHHDEDGHGYEEDYGDVQPESE